MRSLFTAVFLFTGTTGALAQESIKVGALKQPPPESLAAEVRSVLGGDGFRIQDGQGKTIADIWLRKAVPASEMPSGPKGAVLFPFLADGEFVGVLQFTVEGHDYRDQPIAKGVYSLRYGLQPINGDHLGVSTYRDYLLLVPAAKDRSLALLPRKQLEERSSESAGTSHPAVFLLQAPPPNSSKTTAGVARDAEKNTWSVVFPLSIQVKGHGDPVAQPVSLVIIGAAAA
jgi:hypothetical protein